MSDLATHYDPFDESLWGEYARMLLVGTTACSAAVWALRLGTESVALVMVLANLMAIGMTIGSRFAGLLRLAVVSVLIVGILLTIAMTRGETQSWGLVMWSPIVTIGALLLLAIRDGLIAVKQHPYAPSLRTIVLLAIGLTAVGYLVVVPVADVFLESDRERPQSFVIEDLTSAEVLRIRSSKLILFSIFAYVGACVGSFINVVAASAPRGEPIALRSSACPQCGTPIRRIDNLPIISYVRLGGRCRSCQAVIPVRYFTVEVVGLVVFASLFLYELITGAANVPGFRHYHSTGILWIILYTKWPVVGVYVLHCTLFSCLLMFGLMEQDRLAIPRRMKILIGVLFAALVISFSPLLTASVTDQIPVVLPSSFPSWLDRTLSVIVGGTLGWAIGTYAQSLRLRRRQSSSSLAFAFALLGITLGWQAVLTIAVFWLIATALLKRLGGRTLRPQWLTATTLLFVMTQIHHPMWRWLAERLWI